MLICNLKLLETIQSCDLYALFNLKCLQIISTLWSVSEDLFLFLFPTVSYEANQLFEDTVVREKLWRQWLPKHVANKKPTVGSPSRPVTILITLASSEVVEECFRCMRNYFCQYRYRNLNACKFHLERYVEYSTGPTAEKKRCHAGAV